MIPRRPKPGEPMKFFTIASVAEIVGVATRTVRRWIKSGDLVAHRFRGVVRIAEGDLREFLDAHRGDEP
jgi:excisionase family DNA binding protein